MRMKTALSLVICFFILPISPGCGEKHENICTKKPSAVSMAEPVSFIPPSDSAISPARMTAWFNCNAGLDSVSDLFTKSLTADNAAVTDSVRTIFRSAQDGICIKKGLPGGYREYRWILDHIGSSKNKTVYDSLKSCWKK
jgi:hypothetical protein